MFALIANNTQIALSSETKLRYEVSSPVFSTGVITSAVVYPFDMPITGNETIYECAHFLDAKRKYKTIPCTLTFCGILLCSGELVLSKISTTKLRASIIGNAFAISAKDTNIRRFELPSETIISDPHHPRDISQYVTQVVKEEIESMFQFPKMWAELFYGQADEEGLSTLNPDFGRPYLQEINGKFVNNYSGASIVFGFPYNIIREDPDPTNIYTLVPCPFLYKTLFELLKSQGYNSYGAFFEDKDIQNILISSNVPIDKLHPAYFVKASNYDDVQFFDVSGKIIINNINDFPNSDENNCFDTTNSEYIPKETGYHHIKFSCDFMLHISQALPYKNTRIRIKINEATAAYVDQSAEGVVENWIPGVFESTIWIPDNWINLPLWLEVIFLESGNPELGWYPQAGSLKNVSIEITNVSKNGYNDFSNTLSLAKHLPDITFAEFLNAVKDTFSLAIWINNNSKEVQVGFTKDVIKSPHYLDLTQNLIADTTEIEIQQEEGMELRFDFKDSFQSSDGKDFITSFPTLNEMYAPNRLNVLSLVENLNVLYHYTVDDNNKPSWFYFADNFYPYKSHDNSKEIQIKLSPVTMHQKNASLDDDVICPKLIEIANSEAFNPENSSMPFKIMLWLGMQENNSGYTYPMASCTGINYKGQRILSLDLNWTGDHGLIEKYYAPLLDLIHSQEKTTVNLSINPLEMEQILSLFLPQKSNKEIRKIRLLNRNYIPAKATFQLTQRGIEKTEVELIAKNNQ